MAPARARRGARAPSRGCSALAGTADMREVLAARGRRRASRSTSTCTACGRTSPRWRPPLGGLDALVFTGGVGERSAGGTRGGRRGPRVPRRGDRRRAQRARRGGHRRGTRAGHGGRGARGPRDRLGRPRGLERKITASPARCRARSHNRDAGPVLVSQGHESRAPGPAVRAHRTAHARRRDGRRRVRVPGDRHARVDARGAGADSGDCGRRDRARALGQAVRGRPGRGGAPRPRRAPTGAARPGRAREALDARTGGSSTPTSRA